MHQIRKWLTTEQVKMLLRGYCQELLDSLSQDCQELCYEKGGYCMRKGAASRE